MKLLHSPTSPYARKARIVLREKRLLDRVEELEANPFEPRPELTAANPLGRVPALLLDNGEGLDGALFDSPVICAYLDALSDETPLAGEGAGRWRVMRGEALADGMMDAAFAIVMERRRPESERSAMWLGRWAAQIRSGVAAAEGAPALRDGPIDQAQIALASALAYLDFRLPDMPWREDAPGLAAWFEVFSARPSMRETAPA